MSERSNSGRAMRWWRENRRLLAFLFLMLAFRSAWADWVSVPTGSMNPTIVDGDRVLVDKHVYGLRIPWTLTRLTHGRDPARGEIVVFDSPVDGTSLVKRVVGVPGDEVSYGEAGLCINGGCSNYSPGDARELDPLPATTRAWQPEVFRESGALPAHDVLRIPWRAAPGFGPVRVPEDSYLVMGDSRDNSADSRVFGFVPRRSIVGRATHVVLSFDRENFYLPRRGRYLEALE